MGETRPLPATNRVSGPAGVRLLQAEQLSALPWLRHGFTTRAGGMSAVYGRGNDLNLGRTKEDAAEAVDENRRRVVRRFEGDSDNDAWRLTNTRQVHSAAVLIVDGGAAALEPGDGLVTATPGLLLAVLAADCVPILLADRRQRAVAAVHAGWRGTVAGIVGAAIERMREVFGTQPADVVAAIGPSIGPCCYTVGEEVEGRFAAAFGYAQELFEGGRLNLWEANRRQMMDAGVPAERVDVLAACTACARRHEGPRFFSHRAEQGHTGRMMGLIGIRESLSDGPGWKAPIR